MARINFTIASIFLLLALASCAPRPAPTETMTVTPAATLAASATPTPAPTPTETPEPGLSEGVITQAQEFFGGSFSIDKDGNLVKEDGTKVEGIKIIAGENGSWAWVKAGETPEQDTTGTPEELTRTTYIVDKHETGDWDGPGWRLETDGTLVAIKDVPVKIDGTEDIYKMPKFESEEELVWYLSNHGKWETGNIFETNWAHLGNPREPETAKEWKVMKTVEGYRTVGLYANSASNPDGPYVVLGIYGGEGGTIIRFLNSRHDEVESVWADVNPDKFFSDLQHDDVALQQPKSLQVKPTPTP